MRQSEKDTRDKGTEFWAKQSLLFPLRAEKIQMGLESKEIQKETGDFKQNDFSVVYSSTFIYKMTHIGTFKKKFAVNIVYL